jgi:CNT family concentrative nucleoside transporter
MEKVQALFGLFVLVALCWAFSTARRSISWRLVAWGVGLQLVFAAAILVPDLGQDVFTAIDTAVRKLVSFSEAGATFVFQSVEAHQIDVLKDGIAVPTPIIGAVSPPMKTIAFWVLPTVIFFSALMSILYHYGIMQRVVGVMAKVMQKTMGSSGAESLSAAANVFVGQTEAPLLVRPYVAQMTMSELHCIMVGGFATVAGGVMAIYVAVVPVDGIAGHLVTASIISAPAAIAVAKLLVPETGVPVTLGGLHPERTVDPAPTHVAAASDELLDPAPTTAPGPDGKLDVNGIDAIARGAIDGLKLYLNIVAMLFVFYALVNLVNAILGGVGGLVDLELSLELLFGYAFAPFAWLMGVPLDECVRVGMLLGKKLTLTELMAYLDLGEIQRSAQPLTERTAVITSYALCGFANFASVGIQIGGISAMAPHRRGDLARLGMRAMFGGTIAAMMTGCVAALFI